MRFLRSCLLAAVVGASLQFVRGEHVLHEKRDILPTGWQRIDVAPKQQMLPIKIALKEQNIDQLHDLLMSVADPDSPTYTQHWTPEQLRDKFASSEETVGEVKAWLLSEGIAEERMQLSGSKSWLHFSATVEEAEKLFHTTYHTYKHAKSGKLQFMTDAYHVPDYVQEHIDFVTPTLHFSAKVHHAEEAVQDQPQSSASIFGWTLPPIDLSFIPWPTPPVVDHAKPDGSPKTEFQLAAPQADANSLSNCVNQTTPACLRALYGFGGYTQKASAKNSYGIVEYDNFWLPSDLSHFLSEYQPNAATAKPTLVSIDGGYDDTATGSQGFDESGEADLDIEYAVALVYPTKVTVFQTGDEVEGASFNDFLDAFDSSYCSGDDPSQDSTYPDPNGSAPASYKGQKDCGDKTITYVVSTSYGYNEADLTPKYEQRQCNEYAKLGMAGTSFIYSSGDYGVAGNGGECIDTKTGQYSQSGTRFNPSFPGTCPYVTSVGATQVKPNGNVATDPVHAEEACESVIYSGGGFSNVFTQPSYQQNAVQSYFANYKPSYSSSQYNNSQRTRGYPDVAANGANYVVTNEGSDTLVYGTSASAPTFGSIVTLLNDQRLSVGKKPLGFLNPSLYKNTTIFNDITQGTNQGCGTQGFSAVPGWDPVTGLGTPNFPAMLSYFSSLS